MDPIDRLIAGFDTALRTVAGVHREARPSPAEAIAEGELNETERAHAAALMRINHVGEVCAQALYQGQALTARNAETRRSLERAAQEEEDHLAWSADRVHELGGHLSVLNPLWYAGSLALGVAAGALGDRWSLAFLAETEHQVEDHLASHLAQLSPADARTRAIVEQMRGEEAAHRAMAQALGAAQMPAPARDAMRLLARGMTTLAYRL
ncbi:MAG: 2-octaprenyl-3-methyl-6-methoxy-1,4-benzoquinol hydroxylase [Betaproteobacteria bacterium RIFCSPLOWO2_02_67_12]|nr:MAG: 2-octaprenyl-3-methyl-6-methoxy-1,4-benzoquinol hydroxylase [Betaproteobacteria bacterium RIFCSPLOWO2_02_67_12]OGA67376.1 MAG: 2-octaprenyl-3-methyl-6-methoxy-1,4-benzoquinol hydroxylase [Betaproteobacteria bacterium RIFCSPLOWO2_12_FULL_67_28]